MEPQSKSMADALQQEESTGPNHHRHGVTIPKSKSIAKSAHIIRDVKATSDSVVAKAVVTLESGARRLDVNWGDGRRDIITSPPGYVPLDTFPGPGTATLQPGQYVFHHAYDEPAGGEEFSHQLAVFALGANDEPDFLFADVTLTPLYDVYFFDVSLRLGGPCDPILEKTSEFHVIQRVPGEPDRTWPKWEPSNQYFEYSEWDLFEGSTYHKRVRAKERVSPWFILIETDPGIGIFNFDDYYSFSQGIDDVSTFESGWVGNSTGESGGECQILYKYYVFTRLHLPLPQSGPVVAALEG